MFDGDRPPRRRPVRGVRNPGFMLYGHSETIPIFIKSEDHP